MADLTTTTQLFKKIGAVLIALAIIALLVGLIVFRVTRKPPEEPPTPVPPPVINQNPDQKQPDNFDFGNTKKPEFPKELPVYFAQPYKITEAAAKTLASNLGLPQDPTSTNENALDGKEYTWNQGNLRLIISQTSLQYWDRRYKNEPLPSAGELSLDQLQEKATSFVRKITVLGENLEIEPGKTKYWVVSGNDRLRLASLQGAQMVTFSYKQKLAGLPIVDNHPMTSITMVRVKRDGEVVQLFSRFFYKFSKIGSYTLKSTKEAIEEIKNGKGRIVLTQIVDEKGLPLGPYNTPVNPKEVSFTNISLSYFLPNDITEPIQPIFVFEGKFQEGNVGEGRIIIYLPAIK